MQDSWHDFFGANLASRARNECDEHKNQPPARKVPVLRKANQTPTEEQFSKLKPDEPRVARACRTSRAPD